MAELTLGSLFDGLGGWQLAALHNGVRPVWSSEIEAFPMAITKKHFPDTLQLGDITKLDGADLPPVDIICAGSPCQDLSVAGKRKGLEGERSGLFRKAINIVSGMREATNGEYPKIFIWENVPGAFSSNKGADFQAVLEEITEAEIPMPASGRWAEAGMVRSRECDIAWRVLDAQYWGVPQRRKRIFLIADFREKQSRNTAVLFEPESVPGNPALGGTEGKDTPERVRGNIDEASRKVIGADLYNANTTGNIAVTVTSQTGCHAVGSGQSVLTASFYPNNSEKTRGIGYQEETSATIRAEAQTMQPQQQVYSIAGNTIDRQIQNGGNGKGVLKDKSYTLNTIDRHAVTEPICIGNGQMCQLYPQEKVGALNCMHEQQAIITAKEHKA